MWLTSPTSISLSPQVHRYEVQGGHVHRFLFPQLLLWRCLLCGVLFQELHLCGLVFLQHRCVFERGTFFPSISGNTVWHISLTHSTFFGLISELSVREPGFHHLWLCFIPLNYSLTLRPLHRLAFWTQWPAIKSETKPVFYYIWCFKCLWRN